MMAKWPGGRRNKFRGPLSGRRGGRGGGRRGRRTKAVFHMGIDDFKSYFFDRDDWDEILEPAEREALATVGFILMTSMRGSMRRRKKASKPGSTPTVWTGLLRDKIFFAFDDSVQDQLGVIVGPAFIKSAHKDVFTITQPTIPATLEFGGKERIRGKTFTIVEGERRESANVSRTVTIAPRPYASKALEAKRDRVFEVFEDMLGKSPMAFRVADSKRPSSAA